MGLAEEYLCGIASCGDERAVQVHQAEGLVSTLDLGHLVLDDRVEDLGEGEGEGGVEGGGEGGGEGEGEASSTSCSTIGSRTSP